MKALEHFLEAQIGLDCASLGPNAVEAALRTRMRESGVSSRDAYLALVRGDPVELTQLIEEVVVTETWFMRDGEPFAELARVAQAHAGSWPLRILSMPCATGEEPYSIAITLCEAGLGGRFSVDAIDISARALEQARRGVFGARSFRGDSAELLRRWFSRSASSFAIHPEVRAHVSFREGNLLNAALLAGQSYDVIFCRNVLIYLQREARTRALAGLLRALNPGGRFFAGHAEALHGMDARFQRAGPVGAFCYHVSGAPALRQRKSTRPPPPVSARKASREQAEPARPARPSPPRPRGRAAAPRTASGALEDARALADRGLLDQARQRCVAHLAAARLDASAHVLLGVILQAQGDLGGARQSFERALYLEPRNEEALEHLAVLHQRRGEPALAEGVSRRAMRARSRRDGS